MTFSVLLHSQVSKFLDKLPKDVKQRIIKKFRLLRENPFHYLEHFEGEDFTN